MNTGYTTMPGCRSSNFQMHHLTVGGKDHTDIRLDRVETPGKPELERGERNESVKAQAAAGDPSVSGGANVG